MRYLSVLGLVCTVLLWQSYCLQSKKTLRKAPKLEKYPVDGDKLSVSGISSGAYFAVQFHVAFSKDIMGLGALAGGPFWCAQDDLEIAKTTCTANPEKIDVGELVAITFATAASGTIDPPSHMKNDKIFLFSGSLDTVVDPGVVKKLAQYYSANFLSGPGASMAVEYGIPAEHAMVTADFGNECGVFGSPYINKCNYSAAYHILQQIYGDIQAANDTGKVENLLEFDQSEFFLDDPDAVSMDSTGFIYVPTNCQTQSSGALCRLHIAFHGCQQGRQYLSDEFPLHAGYNGLAEANNIIVLYPQARNSTIPFNPQGCWDWWGYTSPDYACKLGPQMAGVKLMLDRVAGL